MDRQYDEKSFNVVKGKYIELCNSLDIVQRVEDSGEYVKLYTNILLGKSNDFLNLYLIFEDGDVGLSDSNNIYAVLDDYYEVDSEMLSELAQFVGLDYEEYRFTKWVTLDSILDDLERFDRVVKSIVNNK